MQSTSSPNCLHSNAGSRCSTLGNQSLGQERLESMGLYGQSVHREVLLGMLLWHGRRWPPIPHLICRLHGHSDGQSTVVRCRKYYTFCSSTPVLIQCPSANSFVESNSTLFYQSLQSSARSHSSCWSGANLVGTGSKLIYPMS